MAIPSNFNPWEHLQDTLRKIHNKLVREWFREDIVETDINAPESSLKLACLMDDKDTFGMTIIRILLFFFYAGFFYQEIAKNIYGVPSWQFHDSIEFFPQLVFQFQEPYTRRLQSKNKNPKRVEVKYRLFINPDSVTESTLETLKSAIDRNFRDNYEIYCGYDLYVYRDRENKITIQFYANSETNFANLVRKILDVLDSIPNLFNYKYSFNSKLIRKVDIKPNERLETITVAGDRIKKYRNQTTGYVKLKSVRLYIQNWFGDGTLYNKNRL